MLYIFILETLQAGEAGWGRTFPRQLARLRDVLSNPLLAAVGLSAGKPVPTVLTLADFRDRIWQVRKDRSQPKELRDEAIEFDTACGIYLSERAVKPDQKSALAADRSEGSSLGLPCDYCWRSDVGPFVPTEVYLRCHVHRVPPDPGNASGLSDQGKLEVRAQRRRRNAARQAERYSKALLAFKDPDLFFKSATQDQRLYPKSVRSCSRPTAATDWLRWIEAEYPVVASALRALGHDDALSSPLQTICLLESRNLTKAEMRLYETPICWEVPVAKCSAWLALEACFSLQRGREPNPEGLLLSGLDRLWPAIQ